MSTTANISSTFSESVSDLSFVAVYYDSTGQVVGGASGCTSSVDPGMVNGVETAHVSPVPGVAQTVVYPQWKQPGDTGGACLEG